MAIINSLNLHKSIHFIGIGGISQSALAEHYLRLGFKVSGSDRTDSDILKRLRGLGARIWIGHSAGKLASLGYRLGAVVYTSAVQESNVELQYAMDVGIAVLKRSQLLGMILSQYNTSICVSGSHGKTTATAMLAHIFSCARLHPTAFIGGEDAAYGNYFCDSSDVNLELGNRDFVIAEACEYKKNFLDLKPSVAVVLNIDDDHRDSYADMEDMTNSFYKFISGCIAVLNADDECAATLFNKATVTFGIKKAATYTAKNIECVNGRYSFSLYVHGRKRGKITLSVLGKHNVYNALAAIAVADLFNVRFDVIKKTLAGFKGVKRRGEFLGEYAGLRVYADYAHHPKEITATLAAFKESGLNPVVVFQPHTYSRTQALLKDFVIVLSKQERVIIYKTYPARERYKKAGSAKTLYSLTAAKSAGSVVYASDVLSLLSQVNAFVGIGNNHPNYLSCEKVDKPDGILILGAGDIYKKAKRALGLTKKGKKR